jgi:hypothetical protein
MVAVLEMEMAGGDSRRERGWRVVVAEEEEAATQWTSRPGGSDEW